MSCLSCRTLSRFRSSQHTRRRCYSKKVFNTPVSGKDLMKPAGLASMLRLPVRENAEGLDACFVGITLDIGCSNRSGARFGPRHIRLESAMIRAFNMPTGAAPYESIQVADIGDLPFNTFDLRGAVKEISHGLSERVLQFGCTPLVLGGDHTILYPILQAIAAKHGPVGLIQVDAHTDTAQDKAGRDVNHGTPVYHAVQEGLVDSSRVVQIGLRGSGYLPTNKSYAFSREQGFRVVPALDCWHKSLTPLMCEVRQQMGAGPVYLTFDIDGVDPAFAPGTGTPEVGGLTSVQALEIVRGCRGLNLVGCDVVEVSPPYDSSGITSLLAANLLFEMLCVLPGVKYYPRDA